MHSLRRWSFLLGTGLFSLVSGAVVPMPPGITPAPHHIDTQRLQDRQESPDAIDFIRVLITALPQSIRQVAATNVPAVSRMLWEEFLDDNRPEWFRELPIEIQRYLIDVFGPVTAAPPESYATPTDVPASVTSQPTETNPWQVSSTARSTWGSRLTSAAAESSTSIRATSTSTRALFTAFPSHTRSTPSPSASSLSSSASSPSSSASTSSSSASQTPKSSSTTLVSTSAPSSAPPSNTPTDTVAPAASDSGLSRNEKLAIGLGVPLGTLSIAALLFGCFLWWRRRKRQIEGSQPPSSPGFIPRFSFHIADADGYTERLNPGAQHGIGERNWDDTDEHEVGYDVDTAYHGHGYGIPPAATQMSMQDGHTPMIAPGLYHSHSSNRARGRQISVSSLHSVAEMREPEEIGADSPVLGRYHQHKRGSSAKRSEGRSLVHGPGGFVGYAWSGEDVGRTGDGAMPVPSRPAPVPLHATAQYSGTGSSSSGLAGSSMSSQSQSAHAAYRDDYVPEYYYTSGRYDGPYEDAHIGRGY